MIKTLVLPIFLVLFITSVLGGAIGGVLPIGGFFQSPIAHIQLPAEAIPGLGIYNTSLTFWVSILVLLLFIFFSTKNLKRIPESRLQSIAEVIVDFFLNLSKSISGSEKGRRFVPVVLSIFLCVVVSNWVGVLPGVGTIGIVESSEVVYKHKEHKVDACHNDDHGSGHNSENKEKYFECDKALKEHLVVFNETFLGIKYLPPGRGEIKYDPTNYDLGSPEAKEARKSGVVLVKDTLKLDYEDHNKALVNESKVIEGVHKGKTAGRLLPLFRGANTDLNTTLAIAIVAMFFVTYWGISELGIKKYGAKFINFSSPIMLFVGILELIAEFARVVSFTFRLFGNMFAGEVLLIAMMFLLPFIGIVPFMGLELFVGVIQAFIFSMLTLIFAVTAVADHSEH